MAGAQTIETDHKTITGSDHEPTLLAITGMSCGNCARHVTEALQSTPGVRSASVSLDSQQARITWKPDTHRNVNELIHSVEKAGYGAKVIEAKTQEEGSTHAPGAWGLNLWIGVPG